MPKGIPGSRGPTPHGTVRGYIHYECRCDDCLQANREYYGRRSLIEYLTDVAAEHGTESGYSVGCRCDRCREASAAARRRRRYANIEVARAYDREYKRTRRAVNG